MKYCGNCGERIDHALFLSPVERWIIAEGLRLVLAACKEDADPGQVVRGCLSAGIGPTPVKNLVAKLDARDPYAGLRSEARSFVSSRPRV